jgi:hypothetical protein
LISWFKSHLKEWYDIQDTLRCCGYASETDTLATGPWCIGVYKGTPPADIKPCRTSVLTTVLTKSQVIGGLAVGLISLELLALIASFCLCCRKPPTNDEVERELASSPMIGA